MTLKGMKRGRPFKHSIDDLSHQQKKRAAQRMVTEEISDLVDEERELTNKTEAILETRYQRLRQSSYFPAIMRMAMNGASPLSITKWLQEKDPAVFGTDKVKHSSLHSQVVRFARELIDKMSEVAKQEGNLPFSMLDYAGEKYRWKLYDPLARMELLLLMQEERLNKLLSQEIELPRLSQEAGREMDRMQHALERYVMLKKLLGIPYNSNTGAMERMSPRVQEFRRMVKPWPVELKKDLLKILERAQAYTPSVDDVSEESVPTFK